MGRGRKKPGYGGFFVIQIPAPSFPFSSALLAAHHSPFYRSRDARSIALKTLGKERDCSQSNYQGTKRNFLSSTDVFLKGPLFSKSKLNLGRFDTKFSVAVRNILLSALWQGTKCGKFGLIALSLSSKGNSETCILSLCSQSVDEILVWDLLDES